MGNESSSENNNTSNKPLISEEKSIQIETLFQNLQRNETLDYHTLIQHFCCLENGLIGCFFAGQFIESSEILDINELSRKTWSKSDFISGASKLIKLSKRELLNRISSFILSNNPINIENDEKEDEESDEIQSQSRNTQILNSIKEFALFILFNQRSKNRVMDIINEDLMKDINRMWMEYLEELVSKMRSEDDGGEISKLEIRQLFTSLFFV